MAFWKKKKPYWGYDLSEANKRRAEKAHQAQRRQLARNYIEQRLNRYDSYSHDRNYEEQAMQIAYSMDRTGKTKKEVLLLAYQQIRASLTRANVNLDDYFEHEAYRDFKGNWVIPHITDQDRETYFQQHEDALTAVIDKLEQQVIEAKLKLLRKQQINQSISQRVTAIKTEQQAREAKLDQQTQAVEAKLKQLYTGLTLQKQETKLDDDPDLDRLENMLAELRRLKNG